MKTHANSAYNLWRDSGKSKLCAFNKVWCKPTNKCFENRLKSYTQTVMGKFNKDQPQIMKVREPPIKCFDSS